MSARRDPASLGEPAAAPAGRSAALDDVLARFRAEPSRLWSVVVTLVGDAIVPRGGSIWLGSLLAFFRLLDVSEGAVRTAMSRLAADGWLERSRVGRNSFYRLGARGLATFEAATRHIYHPAASPWNGTLSLVVTSRDADRSEAAALAAADFGSPLPGLWIAPGSRPVPAGAAASLVVEGRAEPDHARRLAAAAWPLERYAEAYRTFIATFSGLRAALASGEPLGDAEAALARVLLIHAYRRIVLRDPLLPAELLPADWPGEAARRLCGDLYQAILTPSERWFDAHGTTEHGPLPPAGRALRERFADAPPSGSRVTIPVDM